DIADRGACQVRHLRRAGEGGAPARGLIRGVTAARLHRGCVLAARPHFDLDDRVRPVPGRIKAGGLDLAFENDVAGRFGGYLRRTLLKRCTCVVYGWW